MPPTGGQRNKRHCGRASDSCVESHGRCRWARRQRQTGERRPDHVNTVTAPFPPSTKHNGSHSKCFRWHGVGVGTAAGALATPYPPLPLPSPPHNSALEPQNGAVSDYPSRTHRDYGVHSKARIQATNN
ncbi:hypothetical protein COCC4DRAFT_29608 [Bipolaris maydis ATCC 48331]|uniref:Uncharacterized protein n=2 Tax=Cochliobolus heterostrophus TaxID=5016 RepID=M2UCH1_COCH5|nr:uncharacterized protein COCC4DRAFT_29608 [Bipolaris maydis ATCC 48331]EMD96264.1 hypothetical protein COCHEDRAFT_1019621 [Bipolaris maydis C5]ENI11123.1 hypothetical protein COCC4DRAFT_29608 [Bipolaris maydis ATCC 48331]